MCESIKAVLDTNVLLASLRSRNGASFQVLQMLRNGRWQLVLSNHLLHEYEEVVKRNAADLHLTFKEVDIVLDTLCLAAIQHSLSRDWSPTLSDPDDEPLLQLAFESKARAIVTHNVRHLRPARRFNILVLTPQQFLKELEKTS